MRWNARQKASEQPFQHPKGSSHLKESPTYSIWQRWQENVRRIESFERDHGVPVSLLWWQARRWAVLDHLLTELRLPQV
jgi:hypothetical protein